jgi:FkbM family methyltransferase
MSFHPETSVKYKAFAAASSLLRYGLRLLGPHTGAVAAARLAEQLAPIYTVHTPHGALRFLCPGHIPLWQAENLFAKEPETIDWLERIPRGAVLWDVGANVGCYTLYAALLGARVIAFEPSAANYYLLNRNIALNHLEEHVSAYCLALADRSRLDEFYLSSCEIGEALHSFGHPTNWRAQSFVPSARQAAVGQTIDDLLAAFALPFPQYLKIDVDGIEDQILRGGACSLADLRLRSVLVEINTERIAYRDEIVTMLAASDLTLREVRHAPMFDGSAYAPVYNHIFVREG